MKYGLEKMNEEVAAWMLGLITEDGTKSRPPFSGNGQLPVSDVEPGLWPGAL